MATIVACTYMAYQHGTSDKVWAAYVIDTGVGGLHHFATAWGKRYGPLHHAISTSATYTSRQKAHALYNLKRLDKQREGYVVVPVSGTTAQHSLIKSFHQTEQLLIQMSTPPAAKLVGPIVAANTPTSDAIVVEKIISLVAPTHPEPKEEPPIWPAQPAEPDDESPRTARSIRHLLSDL